MKLAANLDTERGLCHSVCFFMCLNERERDSVWVRQYMESSCYVWSVCICLLEWLYSSFWYTVVCQCSKSICVFTLSWQQTGLFEIFILESGIRCWKKIALIPVKAQFNSAAECDAVRAVVNLDKNTTSNCMFFLKWASCIKNKTVFFIHLKFLRTSNQVNIYEERADKGKTDSGLIYKEDSHAVYLNKNLWLDTYR